MLLISLGDSLRTPHIDNEPNLLKQEIIVKANAYRLFAVFV